MSSAFVSKLAEDLKAKGLSDSSITLYIRYLKSINGGEDFANFNFLKKVDDVVVYLSKFKDSTRKSYIGCIISVLGLYPSNKALTALKNKYYTLFKEASDTLNKTAGERTETQKANWIDWADVEKVWEEKRAEIGDIMARPVKQKGKKAVQFTITDAEYTKLLNFMVLSLYVKTAPRRNEDYTRMYISTDGTGVEDTTKNWLDLKNGNFIFNQFKTSKKYPSQVIPIPAELMDVIQLYLKYYPSQPKTGDKFLVFANGAPLESINIITRILNKVFGKNVGCSMLRHSYLTSKYGSVNAEKEKDAENMGHSVAMQSQYVLQK